LPADAKTLAEVVGGQPAFPQGDQFQQPVAQQHIPAQGGRVGAPAGGGICLKRRHVYVSIIYISLNATYLEGEREVLAPPEPVEGGALSQSKGSKPTL